MVNAMKLLGLKQNYTLDELKSKFKETVINHNKTNPNDTKTFEHIKNSYKLLANNITEQTQENKNNKFNLEQFNQRFEQYKRTDVYENSGYSDWISKTEKNITGNGAIIHSNEPEPLFMDISGLGGSAFYELGIDSVSNFSGKSQSHLEFMDYRLAHTTSSLVDESKCLMPKYKTIDEINNERSKLSYEMTQEQARKIKKQEMEQHNYEEMRLNNIKRNDILQEQIFKQINKN